MATAATGLMRNFSQLLMAQILRRRRRGGLCNDLTRLALRLLSSVTAWPRIRDFLCRHSCRRGGRLFAGRRDRTRARLACGILCSGLPGIVMALLALTIADPPRGATEDATPNCSTAARNPTLPACSLSRILLTRERCSGYAAYHVCVWAGLRFGCRSIWRGSGVWTWARANFIVGARHGRCWPGRHLRGWLSWRRLSCPDETRSTLACGLSSLARNCSDVAGIDALPCSAISHGSLSRSFCCSSARAS